MGFFTRSKQPAASSLAQGPGEGAHGTHRVWCRIGSGGRNQLSLLRGLTCSSKSAEERAPLLSFRGRNGLVGTQPSSPQKSHTVFSRFKPASL